MTDYFSKKNYVGIALGVAVILLGYFCLAQGPADNWISLNVAPVLLIIGYTVILPLSLLLGNKKRAGTGDSV